MNEFSRDDISNSTMIIYYLRNFLYLLQSTGGPRNPNFQVVVMHASHVYTVASMHSFGLPLRMNGIHGKQVANQMHYWTVRSMKSAEVLIEDGTFALFFVTAMGHLAVQMSLHVPRNWPSRAKKGNIANAQGGMYRAVAVSTNYGIGGMHLKAFSFICDTNYSLLLLPNS